jgi:rubrerythrin
MELVRAIECAQAIEAAAADAYRALAARSGGRPEAAVFLRLADEEDEHARRLAMLASLFIKDRKVLAGARQTLPGLEDTLAQLRALVGAIRRGAMPVDQAVARLIDLEDLLSSNHAEVIARSADPRVKQLFELLAAQDREHHELLRRTRAAP